MHAFLGYSYVVRASRPTENRLYLQDDDAAPEPEPEPAGPPGLDEIKAEVASKLAGTINPTCAHSLCR